MEPVNRKKAPQQDVVEIIRIGAWGRVTYQHKLACGHTESRKRPSSATRIACTWCVRAEAKGKELQALVAPPEPREQDDDEDYEVAGLENAEKEALAIKLAIAAALGCPEDAIDVVLEDLDGTLELAGVVVFLDPTQARAIRS